MRPKTFYNLFSFQKRLLSIVIGFIIVSVSLVARLFYLQIIDGKKLQIKATSQWLRDLPIASKRGEIYDTNGVVLASTITSYDIYVRARNVQNASEVSAVLSELLNIDYDKVYAKVTNKLISESLIKMQVSDEIAQKIIAKNLKGVYLSQNVGRIYPFGDLLTQVLGYCSIDNSGQTGIENYYNQYLKGVDGMSLVQANAQGVEIEDSLEYYLPSIAGQNLTLTIDVQLQSILETALNNAYIKHEASSGWGIIYDATDGGILAMSNLPSFDLNFVPRNDLETLNKLSKNSCVVDVYEPGSTFKIITLLASLNEGLTDIDEHFYCSGSCAVDGQKIKCWKTTGHGSQTLIEGFKNSCNCVFVNLAMRLGVERLYKYIDMLGIGHTTGVDIKGESAGIIIDKSKVKNVDLARIGFGQSVAVTPLQMVRMVAGAVTGKMTTPHLLKAVDTDGKLSYKSSNKFETLNIKQETIEKVTSMLFNNVNTDGESSFVPGYNVGGKTGTAQKFVNGAIAQGKYVSSYFGIYPTDKPKYVLLVCINEPSKNGYYGGVVAKPVGQEIFTNLMRIKNIMPDNPSDLTLEPDIIMPDLVGYTVADALAQLSNLNLVANVDGDEGYVISQIPLANTKLFAGEEVVISLSN